MKIQCDVCEKAQATVICCADEAALCTKCDIEVHAANKLASKHQRLLLQCLSNKLPPCDICQDKAAFIFCVEDRALFCKDCDESIHSASSLAANHQRFLATGIRVALSSSCNKDAVKSQLEPQPPQQNSQQIALKTPSHHLSSMTSPSWPVEELLEFPDYESNNKKELLELGELEWLGDIDLFGEQTAAEVPELSVSQSSNANTYRPSNANIYKPSNTNIYRPSNTNIYKPSNTNIYRPAKSNMPYKKPRIELPDEDEFFTVPDLG